MNLFFNRTVLCSHHRLDQLGGGATATAGKDAGLDGLQSPAAGVDLREAHGQAEQQTAAPDAGFELRVCGGTRGAVRGGRGGQEEAANATAEAEQELKVSIGEREREFMGLGE